MGQSTKIKINEDLFFDTFERSDCPFQIYIGGRGVGKTYSTLRNLLFDKERSRKEINPREKFIYMRRMAKEIELSTTDVSNPFKRINLDFQTDIVADMLKQNYAVFYDLQQTNTNGEPPILGYGVGLSTFSGLRGVDFSDVTTIVFDEFIPEQQVRRIKNEGKIFLNMYETVNRNRELQGEEPVRVILLANSITLASEILLEMGAIPTMANMILKNQARATIRERGLYIEIIDSSKFAEYKANTALYKLTKGSEFNREAIMNKFTADNLGFAKKVQINEYKSLFTFCEYTFYQHKSRNEFYLAKRKDTSPIGYDSSDTDRLKKTFAFTYQYLVLSRTIFFDEYATKLVFDTILEVK